MIPRPAYITSGPHLSGYQVKLGYETLAEAQDAHQALATQQSPEGWQDISTAPKDGTRFLAYGGGLDDEIETCSYSSGTGCWNLETYTADDTDDEPQGYCRPTHWRPLPVPPVPSVSGGEDQGSSLRDTHRVAETAVVEHMVQRFLAWRLPETFNPDNGISFKPTFNDHMDPPMRCNPTGTNLFDARQAEAMVRHLLEGLPK